MSFSEKVREMAKQHVRTIVFPEGDDERTVAAAGILSGECIAIPILLGDPEKILGI